MPPNKKQSKLFLGLGKTIYNANVTELTVEEEGSYRWQTLLQERYTRKKWSGQWPINLLEKISSDKKDYKGIAENRDITTPRFIEDLYQKQSLFYELLKKKNLGAFCSSLNEDLNFIPHHIAHAYSAIAHGPYKNFFILVMDGGGNEEKETRKFFETEKELAIKDLRVHKEEDTAIEHTSLFFWNGVELSLLYREGLHYDESESLKLKLSEGIGSAYEKAAQLIFNDNLASGKVMGLAGFGHSFYQPENLCDIKGLQETWPWESAFQSKEKSLWEKSKERQAWQDVAATIQEAFEESLKRIFNKIDDVESEHSLGDKETPVIFTGGCALNCTANFKMTQLTSRRVYTPPCPGDEGISLGLAMAMAFKEKSIRWRPRPFEKQKSAFGYHHSINLEGLSDEEFLITKLNGLEEVAKLLKDGHIVAWYHGDSECGPRALGHRSLLVRPDRENVKDYLNEHIKFRESFRPYGASILWEKAHHYFDIPKGFQNPFMSFATPIREEFSEKLKEVRHVDGTCRMQTVMKEQNPAYYQLLGACESIGMMPILLNTSLNIMGEPIVETPEDALHFLKNSVVRYLVLENILIQKKGNGS